MNIHSVLQQKSATSLGPVKVTRVFDSNPGSKYEFLLIEDGTGKSALKVWDGKHNFQEGQVITLTGQGPKGGLKVSEYNGKISIDANSCRVVFEEGSNAYEAVQQTTAPAQASPARSSSSGDMLPAVMRRCAEATTLYVNDLVNIHGYTRDEAMMLAQNCPSWMPLWWGGEKFMS